MAYTLQDPDDIWKEAKDRPAAQEDPKADILRVAAVKRGKGSDFRDTGELLTLVLDADGGPLEEARRYVLQMMNKDAALYGETEFQDVTGEPAGDPSPNAVEKATDVVRLRTKNKTSSSLSSLLVLSAARIEGKLVVVRCKCDWAEREAFEQNFIQVAGSLRAAR